MTLFNLAFIYLAAVYALTAAATLYALTAAPVKGVWGWVKNFGIAISWPITIAWALFS